MPSNKSSRQRIQAIRKRPRKDRQARGPAPNTPELNAPEAPQNQAQKDLQDVQQAKSGLSELVPYNPRLLNRSRTQLQLGDWEKLADLDEHELQHNPAAAELRLLAAAGYLQKGGDQAKARARSLLQSAIEAGLDREFVARILIGGASNTLGRIAALSDRSDDKVMHHFRSAIAIAVPDADAELLLQPTATRQLVQLTRASGSAALMGMAQRTALSIGNGVEFDEESSDGRQLDEGVALLTLPLRYQDEETTELRFFTNVGHAFSKQADLLRFDLKNGAKAYLVTNPGGSFEDPPGPESFKLQPETLYGISGQIEFQGDAAPIVWVFGYEDEKLVFKKSFSTRQGQLDDEFRTEANVLHGSIGLRLAGSGEIQGKPSHLEITIKAQGPAEPPVNRYNWLRPPKSQDEKPAGGIKVFGTFRSGTNFLRALIEWNFNGELIFSEIAGWKHGLITDGIRDQLMEHQLGCVCIVKHPLSSLLSWFNYAHKVGLNIECAKGWDDFLSSRFVIFDAGQKTGRSEYRFSRPADYWNQMTWNQLSFVRQNSDIAKLVRYEDLLAEPEKLTTELAEFFSLEQINAGDQFLVPERAVTRMGDKPRQHRDQYLAKEAFDKSFYQKDEFYEKFSQAQLSDLRRQLDADLLQALNYML